MKSFVLGLGIGILFLFVLFSITSLETKSNKEMTIEQTTRDAAYQTLKECCEESTWLALKHQYKDQSSDPDTIMSIRFKENLKNMLNTEDTIKVKILESNQEKGVLRVQTSLEYFNMGKENEVTTEETVIYNYEI